VGYCKIIAVKIDPETTEKLGFEISLLKMLNETSKIKKFLAR